MHRRSFRALCVRYIKFLLTSAVGTAADFLVLWVCSDMLFKGSYFEEFILSPFLGFECSVLANFFVAYGYVWRERVSQRSWRSFGRHFFGYNLSCTGSFGVKLLLILLVEWLFHLDVLLCNLIALCFSGLLNFFLQDRLVFGNKNK